MDPEKPLTQDELLKLKITLPNGDHDYIFQGNDKGWFCVLCSVQVDRNTGSLLNHAYGKKHKGKLDLPNEDNKLSNITQNSFIQREINTIKEPMVGLEYLLEIMSLEDLKNAHYNCVLCNIGGDSNNIIDHLNRTPHKLEVLRSHFPKVYNALRSVAGNIKIINNTRKWKDLVDTIVGRIEATFGRLKPSLVETSKFRADKSFYQEAIRKGEHIAETPEHTFVDLIPADLPKVDFNGKPLKNGAEVDKEKQNQNGKKSGSQDKSRVVSKGSSRRPIRPSKVVQKTTDDRKRRTTTVSKSSQSVTVRRVANANSRNPIVRKRIIVATKSSQNVPKRSEGQSSNGNQRVRVARRQMIVEKRVNRGNRSVEEKRIDVDKLSQSQDITEQMKVEWKMYNENPEAHPQYKEEWIKFWQERYVRLKDEGKDPSNYDFKPEWKEYWNTRLLDLLIESKKIALKMESGLLTDVKPVPGPTKRGHGDDRQIQSKRRRLIPKSTLITSVRRRQPPSRLRNASPRRKESPSRPRSSPSRRRESPARVRHSPSRRESPSRLKDSPSRRRESPSKPRISPSRRRESPPRQRSSPTRRRESPARLRNSPNRRKESPSKQSRPRDSPSRRRDPPSRPKDSTASRRESPSRLKNSPSRRRESPSRTKNASSQRTNSPKSRNSPTRRRESPSRHRSSPSRRRESSSARKNSPARRGESPSRPTNSPTRRRESPSRPRDSATRRRESPSRSKNASSQRTESPKTRNSPTRRRESPSRHRNSPSRRRESSSGRKNSPSRQRESPSRPRNSPTRRRESPTRRKTSPSRRRESPSGKKTSPYRRRESPSHRRASQSKISPPRQRDSPHRRNSSSTRTESSKHRVSPSRQRVSPSRRRYSPSPPRRGNSPSTLRRDSDCIHRTCHHRDHRTDETSASSRYEHKVTKLQPIQQEAKKLKMAHEDIEDYTVDHQDSKINIVSVLRLLTALEDRLGSLGQRVTDLLSQALIMESEKSNSSDSLLEENKILLVTAKEKLKGQILAGLVTGLELKAHRTVIMNIEKLIEENNKQKEQRKVMDGMIMKEKSVSSTNYDRGLRHVSFDQRNEDSRKRMLTNDDSSLEAVAKTISQNLLQKHPILGNIKNSTENDHRLMDRNNVHANTQGKINIISKFPPNAITINEFKMGDASHQNRLKNNPTDYKGVPYPNVSSSKNPISDTNYKLYDTKRRLDPPGRITDLPAYTSSLRPIDQPSASSGGKFGLTPPSSEMYYRREETSFRRDDYVGGGLLSTTPRLGESSFDWGRAPGPYGDFRNEMTDRGQIDAIGYGPGKKFSFTIKKKQEGERYLGPDGGSRDYWKK